MEEGVALAGVGVTDSTSHFALDPREGGMRRLIAVAGAVITLAALEFPIASAATLGDVAAALAAPAGSAQATNDWSAFAKLKGAKWQGNTPKRGGNAYYWNGRLPIDGVGAGALSLVGSQKTVQSATVNWPKDIELAQVPAMLASQFPKDTKLDQVRGACPEERLGGSGITRATLADRKPLYLHIQFAPSDRGGSVSTIEMEPQRNQGWIC
jgi:hypothetical protein